MSSKPSKPSVETMDSRLFPADPLTLADRLSTLARWAAMVSLGLLMGAMYARGKEEGEWSVDQFFIKRLRHAYRFHHNGPRMSVPSRQREVPSTDDMSTSPPA